MEERVRWVSVVAPDPEKEPDPGGRRKDPDEAPDTPPDEPPPEPVKDPPPDSAPRSPYVV